MTECPIIPLDDRIIIEAIDNPNRTPGGLYVPDQSRGKPITGKIIAVGTGKFIQALGTVRPMQVKVGDIVIFSHYAGGETRVNGKEYLVCREEDIYGKIRPEAIKS